MVRKQSKLQPIPPTPNFHSHSSVIPPKESEALKLRMDNARITHISISAVLTDNGHPISDSTIGRHRRGRCTGVAR